MRLPDFLEQEIRASAPGSAANCKKIIHREGTSGPCWQSFRVRTTEENGVDLSYGYVPGLPEAGTKNPLGEVGEETVRIFSAAGS